MVVAAELPLRLAAELTHRDWFVLVLAKVPERMGLTAISGIDLPGVEEI